MHDKNSFDTKFSKNSNFQNVQSFSKCSSKCSGMVLKAENWKPCRKTQISSLGAYSSYSTTVLHPSVDVVLDILSTPPLAERWEDSALQHDLRLPLKCSPRPLLSPPSPGKLGKCFKNSSQVSRPAHPPRRWLLHFRPNRQESSPGYLGSGDQLEVDLC